MIRGIGCSHVIIGHSERRQYFGETNETVLKKTLAALEAELTPIVCVGETLEHREGGQTEAVILDHRQNGTAGLTADQFARIVIAYEPVWAIGTGKTATPEIAADAHRVIGGFARGAFGQPAASSLRILYGGSVKPDNVKGLMALDGTGRLRRKRSAISRHRTAILTSGPAIHAAAIWTVALPAWEPVGI